MYLINLYISLVLDKLLAEDYELDLVDSILDKLVLEEYGLNSVDDSLDWLDTEDYELNLVVIYWVRDRR